MAFRHLSALARVPGFGKHLVSPVDDEHYANGYGDGEIEIVMTSSALWMLAIALCGVVSILMVVVVCGGAKKQQYHVVEVMSDTECE